VTGYVLGTGDIVYAHACEEYFAYFISYRELVLKPPVF